MQSVSFGQSPPGQEDLIKGLDSGVCKQAGGFQSAGPPLRDLLHTPSLCAARGVQPFR